MTEVCDICKFKRGKDCPAKDNYNNAIHKGEVVSCNKCKSLKTKKQVRKK